MRPGDVVELRSTYRGRVRWSFPHRVVTDDGEQFALHLAPGVNGVGMGRDPDGRYLERWVSDEPPHPLVWLQAPMVVRNGGLETTDHALDVIVEPDGTWRWKDEDDFAEAQALGVFTPAEAAAVRAEGERVIAARPWPTGWEDWRP